MDCSSKIAGRTITPVKEKTTQSFRSKSNEKLKCSENLNPNVSSPGLKLSKKSASKNPSPNQVSAATPSLKKKIRERKFVIAKKKSRNVEQNSSTVDVACDKCKKPMGKSKCLCLAYEILRASQEYFFKDLHGIDNEIDFGDEQREREVAAVEMEENAEKKDGFKDVDVSLKRSRDKLFEEEKYRVPEPVSGMVMNLVKAFENLSVVKMADIEDKEVLDEVEDNEKGIISGLPGLQHPPKVLEPHVSSSSFCPSEFLLTSESLGLDSRRSHSLDSSQRSFSLSTRTATAGGKSRRNSSESSGTFARRQWRRKQKKATSQKPFILRTEQRGRCKEEEFAKKLQQMLEEEERLRVPVAQGLPWTIDEPECLVKPPVKENTIPVDLVLHSDTRAVERAEFDNQVAEKLSLAEQYRMERERQQKFKEEEETRRLRKELVPKAQPMPYFDRPFVPKRSVKNPTIPKDPKFRVHQHKKIKGGMSFCSSSMNSSSSEWRRIKD